MSSPFAVLDSRHRNYSDLAESHFAQDITESDRAALKKAGSRLRTHVFAFSAAGALLGLYGAVRMRSNVHRAVLQLKNAPKPAEIIMQDGKHVNVPSRALEVREPGPISAGISAFFLSSIGLFIGSNIGLMTGAWSASNVVKNEADAGRLKEAYRMFRVDVLRRELAELEKGHENLETFWQ